MRVQCHKVTKMQVSGGIGNRFTWWPAIRKVKASLSLNIGCYLHGKQGNWQAVMNLATNRVIAHASALRVRRSQIAVIDTVIPKLRKPFIPLTPSSTIALQGMNPSISFSHCTKCHKLPANEPGKVTGNSLNTWTTDTQRISSSCLVALAWPLLAITDIRVVNQQMGHSFCFSLYVATTFK